MKKVRPTVRFEYWETWWGLRT